MTPIPNEARLYRILKYISYNSIKLSFVPHLVVITFHFPKLPRPTK